MTELHVEREGDELFVTWVPAQPGDRLVVGPSPDEADGAAVPPDEDGATRISGLDPAIRHYVHLHPGDGGPVVVAGERLIPLEGTLNFRDLGGYPTSDGRRVRWGRIFRSDALGRLTDADLRYLEHLGVRLICDFRDDVEAEQAPSRVPDHPDLRIERFPIGSGGDSNETRGGKRDGFVDYVFAGQLEEVTPDMFADMYVGMLEARTEPLIGVLERAAHPDNLPLVFHCTAGKDRTGITAALLLSILGVGDEQILDDYALTDRYRTPHRLAEITPKLAEKGIDVERVRPLFSAQRPVLARTLAVIEERYGSVLDFLRGPGGMGDATLARLRELLLT